MKRSKTLAWALAATVLATLVTPGANGQYYVGQDGHLLDANPRIGSMGINPEARLDALVPRVNMYITGNVTGGAAFQGLVPYGSPYEFQGTLGSSTLTNFRRDTLSVDALRSRVTGVQPYVDPSRGVTTYYGGRVVNTGQVFRPAQTVVGPVDSTLGAAQLGAVRQGSLDLRIRRQTLIGGELFPYYTPAQPGQTTFGPRGFVPFELRQGYVPERAPSDDRLRPEEPYGPEAAQGEGPIMRSERRRLRGQEEQDTAEGQAGPKTGSAPGEEPTQQPDQEKDEEPTFRPGVTGEQVRTTAQLLQEHGNERYRHHLERGQALLEQGEFYRAADAFMAATVYRMNDPQAFLGRAHALFGAGEFMSASYLLARALETEPQLAALSLYPVSWFPSTEQFLQRLEDLENWAQRTQRWEMDLLRAYILGKADHVDAAQELLDSVLTKQPDLPAAKVLREAFAAGDAS